MVTTKRNNITKEAWIIHELQAWHKAIIKKNIDSLFKPCIGTPKLQVLTQNSYGIGQMDEPTVSQLQYSYGIGRMDKPTKFEIIVFCKEY
jgi:hypothetical protein